jgi:hypothetical protein
MKFEHFLKWVLQNFEIEQFQIYTFKLFKVES